MIDRYEMLPCPFDGINPDLDAEGDWCKWTDVKVYVKLAQKLQSLNDKYNVSATEVTARWDELNELLKGIKA